MDAQAYSRAATPALAPPFVGRMSHKGGWLRPPSLIDRPALAVQGSEPVPIWDSLSLTFKRLRRVIDGIQESARFSRLQRRFCQRRKSGARANLSSPAGSERPSPGRPRVLNPAISATPRQPGVKRTGPRLHSVLSIGPPVRTGSPPKPRDRAVGSRRGSFYTGCVVRNIAEASGLHAKEPRVPVNDDPGHISPAATSPLNWSPDGRCASTLWSAPARPLVPAPGWIFEYEVGRSGRGDGHRRRPPAVAFPDLRRQRGVRAPASCSRSRGLLTSPPSPDGRPRVRPGGRRGDG